MFKSSRHKNLFIFLIRRDYYKLPKRTTRANGNTYHIFKLNNFRDVHNLSRNKASMDVTLNEFKLLTSTCWIEKFQPLTFDMTIDKYTARYRLRLRSLFAPDTTLFNTHSMSIYRDVTEQDMITLAKLAE